MTDGFRGIPRGSVKERKHILYASADRLGNSVLNMNGIAFFIDFNP